VRALPSDRAARAYASEHDQYCGAVRVYEDLYTEFFHGATKEARARRPTADDLRDKDWYPCPTLRRLDLSPAAGELFVEQVPSREASKRVAEGENCGVRSTKFRIFLHCVWTS
jgi:hypothetical protein